MLLQRNLEESLRSFKSKDAIVRHRPVNLTIEPTAICNLRCVMCPQGIDAMGNRPKHMAMETLDKLRPALSAVTWVELNGIGEPLASPSLWAIIEGEALPPSAHISFNTNMTLLNARRLEQLLSVPARMTLKISLDAATPLTYRRIRRADFNKPLDNIRKLEAARGRKPDLKLLLNMTMMRENIEELVKFVELAKELKVDGVCFWHLNKMPQYAPYYSADEGWFYSYEEQGLWNFPELADACVRKAIARAEEIGMSIVFDPSRPLFFEKSEMALAAPPAGDRQAAPLQREGEAPAAAKSLAGANGDAQGAAEVPKVQPPRDDVTVKDCAIPWQGMLVLADGTVKPCCHAREIGDLSQNSFEEIWNGERWQLLRSNLSRGIVDEACKGACCRFVQNTPSAAA